MKSWDLVALAAGVAIVAYTIAITAGRYRQMPARVPIHFGVDGAADSYGPRSVVWLLVGVQCALAAFYAFRFNRVRDSGELIAADFILGICLWAQLQVTTAVISGSDRIPAFRYWSVFIGLIIGAVLATQFIR